MIHLENVLPALRSLESQADRLAAWGVELAQRLLSGQRLLAAGNGGSAAEAQHLTAELVGRFDGERVPFSAISLHAETSAVTAIANDYGYAELFRPPGAGARAVRGRPHAAVHERQEPQPASRSRGSCPAQRDHLGADRAGAQSAGRLPATTRW